MRPEIEKRFEELALQMTERAERVRCDYVEFVEGLEIIKNEIDDRLEMARNELKAGKSFD